MFCPASEILRIHELVRLAEARAMGLDKGCTLSPVDGSTRHYVGRSALRATRLGNVLDTPFR